MTKAPTLKDLTLKDLTLKNPTRSFVKICPDLTGYETHPALTIGGSDVQIPVVHCCILSECAAYDPEIGTCKKYGQKVTYTKGGEAID